MTTRWGDIIKERRLAVLAGALLLWPVLFWSQRRDKDNSEEGLSNDGQDKDLLIDLSAFPGVSIASPNGFFETSNLDELLDKVSAYFNVSLDSSYVVLAESPIEFESFTFSSIDLVADNASMDSFLGIADYQVYMLGYSKPVDSPPGAVHDEEDDKVAWYHDYAYLLWGALAIVAGNAVYRLHDESVADSSDTIIVNGDTETSVVEDEAPGQVVKSGQLVATSEQGEPVAFNPDSVISEEDSLGQLTITEDGIWTFMVDNELIQFLAADEVLEQIFIVSTFTGQEQEIAVQINGVNDAPELDDIERSASEADAPFTIDLLAESNATDIDGDSLRLVAESVSLIDDSVDAGGVIFDVATNVLRVNPDYYSDLGNGESITISYSFSVTDGVVETSKTANVSIVGDAPPSVEIVINETMIDDVAIIGFGSSSVSFLFSEPVVDFDSTDISLSLGRIENLRQDVADNQEWHADLILTAEDMGVWQYGKIAEIGIDVNRFTDINGNFNKVGDIANYLVIVDRHAIIDDAVAVIDNFIHPEAYYSDANPNLLLEGTDGNDYIDAFTGDNIIYGLAGADILVAAGGDDVFIAGTGDDLLIDGVGDDVYVGGDGDDTLLLNLDNQQQDIFIGGAGFDRVVLAGSLSEFNLSLATSEMIDFTNEYLTSSVFETADVRDIMLKLTELNDESLDPFVELVLTSYAADGVLSMAEGIEFATSYGSSAAALLWELPSFRGISAKDIEGFNPKIPVIELATKTDGTADDISTHSVNLFQAEILIFDDGIVHILDGVVTTEAAGTDAADLFLLAFPNQINDQVELTYTLNDFMLGNDTIVIEGLFEQDENGDLTEVELDTLLDDLELDASGEVGQIDLSSFVDSEGNNFIGEVIVNFAAQAEETISLNDLGGRAFSDHNPGDEFSAVVSVDF